MSLGDFLGKLITAPIKIVAVPLRVIADIADSDSDSFIEIVTDSVEKQVKEIVE